MGHTYAELASVFRDEFNRSADIALACSKTIDYAAAHEEQIVVPLGFRFYNDGYYQPDDICPFKRQPQIMQTPGDLRQNTFERRR